MIRAFILAGTAILPLVSIASGQVNQVEAYQKAFASCVYYLRTSGLYANEIEAATVNVRIRIKNTLRDVFNNPRKYAPSRR